MNVVSLPKYEELKKILLINAGITHMLPSECKALSDRIFKKNGNRISETTFKRIYGFAYSKYSPSLFTLNVLAKYCNYKSWDDFCQKQEKLVATSNDDLNWQVLQQNANKITRFTLQTLKNKTGIPYNQTIDRDFIDYHLDEFINSTCTGTFIAAPAGYGKTVALCQWIEKKMAIDELNNSNDIILLFSSNAIMSALISGRDIHDWMLALLGYTTDNDVNVLLDIKQRGSSKFYLIIDGFDEHMFKSDHFRVILNQLVDIFSFYRSHEWFKLVLTTRSATWINNKHELEIGSNTWFTGFKDNHSINVPLFSLDEIKSLCQKIRPGTENALTINVAENFNHPLYFQFYYQEHKENFSLSNADHLCFYDTISTFILNKVYLGHYSAEKILLIKNLVEELDIKNNVYQINKLRVNNTIKKHTHAYLELLSIGFIRELNESSNYQYNTYIVFGNNDYLEHSIAKILLYNNGNLFDADLVTVINNLLINNTHKVNVLKWCVIHAIKSGQLKSIEYITEVYLNTNEKSDLITFLGEVLESEYSSTNRNASLIQYFKHSFSEKLFDYFFGLELINSDYKKFLQVLLKFELSNKKKILIHSTLAIIAAIQVDLNELESSLVNLKSFPKAEYESFGVNPLNCLDAIYYHLKYGIIKTEVLADLTKLYFNADHVSTLKKSAANDMLYLLGLYTLLLSNNPKKTLRFINFLRNNYHTDILEEHISQYGFFINTLAATSYFELGEHDKVAEIYALISAAYKKSDDLLTPYMRIYFHSLKINTFINTSKENLIPGEMKNVNNITTKYGYKFSKLYISSIILKSMTLQNLAPEFYKQVNYDFNKIIRDCRLNAKLFLQTINK
ncbi:hypothetical protein [Mucilaginibacter sp. UYCu711]|uniref:hypothetical protein n=1 Tax=Mucilaginibacter sp. UYCu711 TaxID=3156339 RepID=UPI003D20EF9B